MEPLIVLAILAVLAGPVLAIMALVAVRRSEDRAAGGTDARRLLTQRLYALENRLAELERQAPGASAAAPATSPVTARGEAEIQELVQVHLPRSAAPPPLPEPPPSPTSSPPRTDILVDPSFETVPRISLEARAAPLDLENQIAGKWFLIVGIVAVLISVSFGLKWVFENDWIGESGRIAIGVLLGALMLPWSQWLLKRSYKYFSEGIAALGEATLFLSVWAGCQYYSLYSRDVGFAAMIAITAVMAAIAIGRDSQRIAVLSLLGGLLTPILVSSGQNQQVVLFSYLLLLGAGALLIQARKNWNSLAPIAFMGAQIYFWGWYSQFFHRDSPLERTVFFATLFFLLFLALPVSRAIRGRNLGELNISIVLLNAFAYSGALFVLLWPDDKWPLTLLFVALAAGHVAAARMIPAPPENQPATSRLIFAGLALTFLTLAIPIRLEGNWITSSFAVEGAILVWTGFRATSNFLRQSGYLLLAISALRLLALPPAGGTLFFNARFGAYAVMIACFAVALWAARSHQSEVAGQERIEIGIFAVLINVYALIALSSDFWDYFGKTSAGLDGALAQHLSLSILWTTYASGLLIWGLQSKSSLLRWQSLVLFGLVVGKVFLYDLSFLERAYRILSFFVLGAVLMAVSFVYSRKLARQREHS